MAPQCGAGTVSWESSLDYLHACFYLFYAIDCKGMCAGVFLWLIFVDMCHPQMVMLIKNEQVNWSKCSEVMIDTARHTTLRNSNRLRHGKESKNTTKMGASDLLKSVSSEEEKEFISAHGRLKLPIDHKIFDPYRRKVVKTPAIVTVAQNILSLFLIPFRLLIAIIATLISYAIVKIFGPSVTKHDLTHFTATLLPPWRRVIVEFATKFLARGLLLSLGFWHIRGRDDPDYYDDEANKATIISNHSSLGDPCLLAYLFAPAFVAKSEVNRLPGIGRVGAAQHAFYIDRMNNCGVSVTEKMMERQRLVAKSNIPVPPVCIFPEGTTTNGSHLLKFRTGAFVAGVPIAPVLIRYSNEWFSPSYESIKTGKYLYGLLSQFANHVEYYRMPVYYPSDDEKKDARLYADNVYALMLSKSEEAFGTKFIPSDANYVDKIEYHSIIRGNKLKRSLRLNMDR